MREIKSKPSGVLDTSLNLDTLKAINTVSDRIIFIDKKGNIIGTSEKIWDRYPYLSIIKLYESLKKGKKEATAEFEDRGRNIKIKAKAFNEVYLLELEDITSDVYIEEFKKKIISTISHELKTPLTIVRGYVELLSLDAESDLTEKILNQIDKVINIVNSVSLLMKGQKGNFEPVDVKSVVSEITEQLKDKISLKDIKLEVEIDENIIVVAEKILFRQMIINLLDNAIKFTEKGKIGLKIYKKGNDIILEVNDTGRGIPEHIQPFIFEKFVKEKESPGLGIGLSLVKTIVKHHGWEIDFVSKTGEGTTFFVKMPAKS
ncbi:sensor histidine kinase [Desulfurobacterium atlanticum]|uniref:histidine kinase n=1 Tax=Desulfurobacterium atlanticum TaxID=240169 RepID=A0A238Y457_9BACT|nr:HAMP domain-containing sensor histidine kinase [Desulfurobacterium atlanticum]SNR65608.1 two-component system, OmpR family, phosphate regulon sensor histidine kinase PhoR [Desulfurobacterium atlanticum]